MNLFGDVEGGYPGLTSRSDWQAIQDEDAYYDGLYSDRELSPVEVNEINEEYAEWIQQVLSLYDEKVLAT